jgi:hypothetical protein
LEETSSSNLHTSTINHHVTPRFSLPVSGRRVQAQKFICGAVWNELLGQQITGSIGWSTNKDVRPTQFVLHLQQIKCKHIIYSIEQITVIMDHVR